MDRVAVVTAKILHWQGCFTVHRPGQGKAALVNPSEAKATFHTTKATQHESLSVHAKAHSRVRGGRLPPDQSRRRLEEASRSEGTRTFSHIIKNEPIVDDEPFVKNEPTVDDEPVVKYEPIGDDEPIAKTEPVVKTEPIETDRSTGQVPSAIQSNHTIKTERILSSTLEMESGVKIEFSQNPRSIKRPESRVDTLARGSINQSTIPFDSKSGTLSKGQQYSSTIDVCRKDVRQKVTPAPQVRKRVRRLARDARVDDVPKKRPRREGAGKKPIPPDYVDSALIEDYIYD
ncbi:hypothetical protein BDV95DRAFT_164056 [Massariosphaeria phaeospora]|uniref:Uncharacterized protein n=1 Tax=Massariosphaeria phaeospora TaxID=100035 RepID=A0A7C8MF28_9PLEO|nr:hypothetical protein BDV95DRAFT_164056 [Massariosphaeria phaeospora]